MSEHDAEMQQFMIELEQGLKEAQAGIGRITTAERPQMRQARIRAGRTQAALAERIATPVATATMHGLAPLLRGDARVLILGSFPSAASLAAQQYYAHPQNHFWRILSAVLEQPLTDMDYAARTLAVKQAGIAIWDVYGACQREGSLDSAIRAAAANDVAGLKRNAPQLRRVCFNGKTAGKFASSLQMAGFETFVLPSTSPAYTLPLPAKLAAWRAALAVPGAPTDKTGVFHGRPTSRRKMD